MFSVGGRSSDLCGGGDLVISVGGLVLSVLFFSIFCVAAPYRSTYRSERLFITAMFLQSIFTRA